MTEKSIQRRRRVLLLANFAYISAKAVAAGVVRFALPRQDLDLRIVGGHPENADAEYAASKGVDGIVSLLGTDRRELHRVLAANPRCPVVFASVMRGATHLPGRRRSAAILCDNAAVAEAAATLLARHDLKEFGYVGTRGDAPEWDVDRREAFVAALARRGFTVRVYLPDGGPDGDDAELAALADWLRALPKPCGLFAAYDLRAMHVLSLCRTANIAVPEQIQVVSADNEAWICDQTSPTLTSVEPDFEGCGHRAVETLLRLMDGKSCAAEETFGVKDVVQRMSTTDMHGSASRAVRARQYLRAHAAEPLGTARIAEVLGCSPRLLQLSYRAVFGRTVQDDLAEARLDLAKKLLSNTDTPVCDIPGRVGVASLPHFMTFFRRRTGMTMLQWRNAQRREVSSASMRAGQIQAVTAAHSTPKGR